MDFYATKTSRNLLRCNSNNIPAIFLTYFNVAEKFVTLIIHGNKALSYPSQEDKYCLYCIINNFQCFNNLPLEAVIVYLLYNLIVISCGAPPPPPLSGEYDHTGLKYGDTATYTCDPGYAVEGNQILTCDSTGEWGQPPRCISE